MIPAWFLFGSFLLVGLFAFGMVKMVHHVFILGPLRSLFGVILFIAAAACFLMAIEKKREMVSERQEQMAAQMPAQVTTWHGPNGSGVETHSGNGGMSATVTGSGAADKDASRVVTTVDADSGSEQAESSATSSGDKFKRPDWIDQQPHDGLRKTDGAKIHIETVSAGPYPTDEECDLAIQGEIDRAVKDYAETTFPNFGADSIKLDQKTINHLVQAREYEPTIKTSYGKMREEHALLRFDPQVLIAIEQQCRSFVARPKGSSFRPSA